MVNVSGAGGGAHTLDGDDHSDVPAITEAQGMVLYRDANNWVALSVGVSGQFLQTQGAGSNVQWATASGSGDVSGPTADVTDNALARWNGTSGGALQNAIVLLDDNGNITGVVSITIDNAGLHLVHAGTTDFDLIVSPGSTLTADRTLTLTTGDANRTLTISADITLDQSLEIGANVAFGVLTMEALHLNQGTTIFDLIFAPGSALTADRTLTLTTGDSDRTLTINGNATLVAGVMAALGVAQTFTAANIFDGASASLEVPNAAGGRTVDADGEVTVDSTPTYGHFNFFATQENALSTLLTKSITIEDPTSSEDITLGFFDEAVTVRQINDVVQGSTPSLTWNIYHATTKDATAPNTVFSSDRVTTSTSGAESAPSDTNRDDDTIPAGSWVWFQSSAESGTTDEFSLTISLTVDP